MPVSVGDVLQVTFKGTHVDQTTMNTFHYGVDTLTGAPTQDAFAAEVTTAIGAVGGMRDKFLACTPNSSYNLDEIWVQFILDIRYRKYVTVPNLPGTFVDTADTPNVAGVISRFGATANRRNQGSLHIPIGTRIASCQAGFLSSTLKTALTVFSPHLHSTMNLATLGSVKPILIHGTSKLNAIPLTTAMVQDTVRVMRRRTVRVGI